MQQEASLQEHMDGGVEAGQRTKRCDASQVNKDEGAAIREASVGRRNVSMGKPAAVEDVQRLNHLCPRQAHTLGRHRSTEEKAPSVAANLGMMMKCVPSSGGAGDTIS